MNDKSNGGGIIRATDAERPVLTSERIDILVQDWRTQLAIFEDPHDLVDLADKVEFIRSAAAKAGHARTTLNNIGAVLWDVIRRAGQVSCAYERPPKGRPKNSHGNSFPSAKELGYRSPTQRDRWEACWALPQIEVDRLKEKILATSEGILTQAALVSAGKHLLRQLAAEEKAVESGDGCTVDDLQALIDAGKTFGVIYADPPWVYKVYSGKGKSRSADRHYKIEEETGESTLSIEELMELPVPQLAADDCALFLWGVWPELPGALELMRAWGFTYKTAAFVWVKTNEKDKGIAVETGEGLHWGMGYWTRANTEFCLLGTRGSPQRLNKDIHQVIVEPVGQHSRKPEKINERIERLVGGPYLEMFARRPMEGWTVWGNEIARGLFHQEIPHLSDADDEASR